MGRSLFMIMEILHLCMQRGCRVWTIGDRLPPGMTSRPRSWPSPLASPRRLSATSSPSAPERPWPGKEGRGGPSGPSQGGLVQERKAHRQRGRHTGPAGRGHQLGPDALLPPSFAPPGPVAKSRMLEARNRGVSCHRFSWLPNSLRRDTVGFPKSGSFIRVGLFWWGG